MTTARTPFTYADLKTAINDNKIVEPGQLSEALEKVDDHTEISGLIEECESPELQKSFASYLLKKNDSIGSVSIGLSLIKFVRAIRKDNNVWQEFSKDEQIQYTSLLNNLISSRNLKAAASDGNNSNIRLVIMEGIRCKNKTAYENLIRYTYMEEYGYRNTDQSARKLCYEFASILPIDGKQELENSLYPTLHTFNHQKYNAEINFINCLNLIVRDLCTKRHLLSNMDPEGYDLDYLARISKNRNNILPGTIYIQCRGDGLYYEVVKESGRLKKATIPWDDLPDDFPRKDSDIIRSKQIFLPFLRNILANERHLNSVDSNYHTIHALMRHYGETLVKEIFEELSKYDHFKHLKYLLAMYYVMQSIHNFDLMSPRRPYNEYVDIVESYIEDLAKNKTCYAYFIAFIKSNPRYGDVLFALACQRGISDADVEKYLARGSECHHLKCIIMFVQRSISYDALTNKYNTAQAMHIFDRHLLVLDRHQTLELIKKMLSSPIITRSGLDKYLIALRDNILTNPHWDEDIPSNLQFYKTCKINGIRHIIRRGLPLAITSLTAYIEVKNEYDIVAMSDNKARKPRTFYVTETEAGLNYEVFGEDSLLKKGCIAWRHLPKTKLSDILEEKDKLLESIFSHTDSVGHTHLASINYDPYKLYISFDPMKIENYIKCWSILLTKVLPEDNIDSAKLLHPKEAYNDPSATQPGKNAVVYFKRFSEMQLLRGPNYTLDDYYQENFNFIKKLEKLCQEAGLIPGTNQATPEGGLRAKVDEKDATFVFISARDQDPDGKYKMSNQRGENVAEENPYTNTAIVDWHRKSNSARHRQNEMQTTSSSSSTSTQGDTRATSSSAPAPTLGTAQAALFSSSSSTDDSSEARHKHVQKKSMRTSSPKK